MEEETGPETRSANIRLSIYGEPLSIRVDVSTGKTSVRKMLPIFRDICGSIIDATVKHVNDAGRTVTCAAGCGACCRQMVPISPVEARLLLDIVDGLPEMERSTIKERFKAAIERMEEAGLMSQLRQPIKPVGPEYKELGLRYFEQEVPCPFLENESCSIHPERPLVCREYLVVSDPDNCKRKNGKPIEAIKMPSEASKALTSIDGPTEFTNWVPLILALEWAEQNPETETPRPGTDIAARFFETLTAR